MILKEKNIVNGTSAIIRLNLISSHTGRYRTSLTPDEVGTVQIQRAPTSMVSLFDSLGKTHMRETS